MLTPLLAMGKKIFTNIFQLNSGQYLRENIGPLGFSWNIPHLNLFLSNQFSDEVIFYSNMLCFSWISSIICPMNGLKHS